MKIAGIDEAGRGPCLGPLVICAAVMEEKELDKLIDIEVKDSKLMSPLQREAMFEKIKKILKKYEIIIIHPSEIDDAVKKKNKLNLNWLEAEKSAGLINSLKPDKAIMDCPSPNIPAFSAYIKKRLNNPKIIIQSEHKADLNYPIVSAASVIAKVTRDREIQKIQAKIKEPIGSGYPADPITQAFLKKNYKKYPELFRKSWACYRKLSEGRKQKKLGEF